MANYKGYFRSLSNILYEVQIITDSASTAYTEVLLSGDEPFKVTYETSSTPFDPIRISTAVINLVADDYLLDIYPIHFHDTQVKLINTNSNVIEWIGYIKPYIYNQGYENCIETIELQASDGLASLQYYNYSTISTQKQFVDFKSLILHICEIAGNIDGFFISQSGKTFNNTLPFDITNLYISERNFFSDDNDEEPWKAYEVLEELCTYLGYTAVQWKNKLYLIENQALTDSNNLVGHYYGIDGSSSLMSLPTPASITANSYRGNGGNISFEQIYSKASVVDEYYYVDNVIPDIFDEDYITYTLGDKWKCEEIPWYTQYAHYVDERNRPQTEGAPDSKYSYYQRPLEHKYYTSVYRDDSGNIVPWNNKVNSQLISSSKTNTHTSLSAIFTNNDTVPHTINAYVSIFASWWDPDEQIQDQESNEDYITFTLAAGESRQQQLSTSITEQLYPGIITNEMEYNVDGGLYADVGSTVKADAIYVGGTLIDFANVANGNFQSYNYETPSEITFTKYIRIYQKDKPNEQNPRISGGTWLDTTFPSVFKLNSGYTLGVATDEDSFLVLNCSAIWERYNYRPYINPDWTGQCTGIGGDYNVYKWGIISGTKQIHTVAPALVFKLGVGNLFWNGSAWTTTECSFYVNMSTPSNEDGSIDYSNWWNSESKVLNNVSWKEWAGVKGYKIPLNKNVNFNNPITFEVHMPSKLQYYQGNTANDGFNSYCWIKELSLKMAHKGSKKIDEKEDKRIENVIDEGSVNELPETKLRVTTYDNENLVSFSNVLIKRNSTANTGYDYLRSIKDEHLSNHVQSPEENLIERLVGQYNSLTKKETITVDLSFTPLQKVVDNYWNEDFVILGQEIDYATDRQEITLCQIKANAFEEEYAEFDTTTVSAPQSGDTFNNGVSANTEWVLSASSWIELTNTESGTTGWEQIQFKVDVNGSAPRTGYVLVLSKSSGLELDRITVNQAGAATVTGISFSALTWQLDAPFSGGTVDKNNCRYFIYAHSSDGTSQTVTPYATVTGTLNIPASTVTTRHSAGTLTLTATYSGFTATGSVTAYQEAYPVNYTFNLNNSSRFTNASTGNIHYGGVTKNVDTLNDSIVFDKAVSSADVELYIKNPTPQDAVCKIFTNPSSPYATRTIAGNSTEHFTFTIPAPLLTGDSIWIGINETT